MDTLDILNHVQTIRKAFEIFGEKGIAARLEFNEFALSVLSYDNKSEQKMWDAIHADALRRWIGLIQRAKLEDKGYEGFATAFLQYLIRNGGMSDPAPEFPVLTAQTGH